MPRVHVGLDLENETAEKILVGLDRALVALAWRGWRGHGQKLVQEGFDAEIGQGAAEKDRGQLACQDALHIQVVPGDVQKLDVRYQALLVAGADDRGQAGVVKTGDLDLDHACAVVALAGVEPFDPVQLAVVDALEIAVRADRPVDRDRVDAQHLLQLVHQVKRVPGRPVHLVDKGEDRDLALPADGEQLDGLGLDALGAVDQHDRRVSRTQGPVGVFGKILVARGVQDVDAKAVVIKLHDRGGHGNTALLFDFHPVGGGMAAGFARLDGAGQVDGAAIEQQFFRHGCFAGVRMRDDRECAAPGDFRAQALWHGCILPEWCGQDPCLFPGSRRTHGWRSAENDSPV